MASEDVIELGSSDDEVQQPTPKKAKTRPNAMVHIPTSLRDVTIKPTPSHTSPFLKAASGKVAKNIARMSQKIQNPAVIGNKYNGKPVPKIPHKQGLTIVKNPIPIQNKTSLNPVSLFKKLNSQVVINKVSSSKIQKKPVKSLIRVCNPQTINNFPPNVTVSKTLNSLTSVQGLSIKRGAPMHITNTVRKKQKLASGGVKMTNEVLTVELDDDDTSASSNASPQWYLRPEEQETPLEKENNQEPEPNKFIEITIEDSPVKPKSDQTCQINDQFTVTIEDSPAKAITENKNVDTASDEENNTSSKSPSSRKKLEYPKDSDASNIIEIEIEPMIVETQSEGKTESNVNNVANDIVEIEESPLKDSYSQSTSTPKKNHYRPELKFSEKKPEAKDSGGEFHPVYQNFIDLCFQLENSDDMKKIVEKKIKAYYRQVPKEYTESEVFIDMVSSKILAMKAGPDKMYLYIKDIVDELNLQRKISKTMVSENVKKNSESENFLYGENSEFDSKRQRQIRKLEKTLKKLHRAIQKLEEQEVDFDDEEDSVYLLTERYKERMVRVHAKFCQLTNTKMPSEPRVQIDPRPGQPAGPAKRLEKWINKKVPIGTPLPFPDFHDVLRCVKEANEEDRLGWNDVDIMEEARDLFTRCGKKLQRRRQENEWRLAASRIQLEVDPAEQSEDLKKKLEHNRELASKKETDVLNKYADKQNQLKLEAEEIGDKEAEESPVESEEEEIIDEVSLENKDKRKERLKRLLQERSKKSIDEKENQVSEPKAENNVEVEKETNKTKPDEKDKTKEIEANNENSKTVLPEEEQVESNTNASEQLDRHSDDSSRLESDIDELHLLQKLHSSNEINSSTLDSSDSASLIAISDTLESSEDDKKDGDVISIENSSYSETEMDKEKKTKEIEDKSISNKNVVKEVLDHNVNIEISANGVEVKQVQTTNDEYNESIEDILLASSDDENEVNKETNSKTNENCINLKDDSLSVGDTVIEGVSEDKNNVESSSIKITSEEMPVNKSLDDNNHVNSKMDPNIDDCKHHTNNKKNDDSLLKEDIVMIEDDAMAVDESSQMSVSNDKINCSEADDQCVSLSEDSGDVANEMANTNIVGDKINTISRGQTSDSECVGNGNKDNNNPALGKPVENKNATGEDCTNLQETLKNDLNMDSLNKEPQIQVAGDESNVRELKNPKEDNHDSDKK